MGDFLCQTNSNEVKQKKRDEIISLSHGLDLSCILLSFN